MSWRVCASQCKHCLFGPSPLVSKERRTEILDDCRKEGRSFECHLSTIRGEKVTCRAFYDQPDRLLPDLAVTAKALHETGILKEAVEFIEMAELDDA